MPTLPPYFYGKINGVLIISISDIIWYKSCAKSIYVQFEWTGSQEKHKLLTSKNSKITYDIRTSYRSFLNYLSTCTLKCSVNSCENKTLAHTYMKNLLMVSQDNPLITTLPLINNEETVGTLQLCFNLQTFNDTSFDYDIKYLKQFGIQNKILKAANNEEFHNSEIFKPRKYVRPVSSSSVKSINRSKEELTSDYLMGKYMTSDEEEEALNTLRVMPSAESLVSAAEKIAIYSPPLSPSFTPLHLEGVSKMMTIKPTKNIVLPTKLKKPCAEFPKKYIPKDNVYLHLSVLSINMYHTIKSLQNYINCTYIVQCLKDQEPNKFLRFISKHMDNNVVRFKDGTLSSHLEGCTAKGVTIKAYVRLLSERNPVVLGETKQMLDWTGFSTTFGVSRYIKVPIWLNNKITGHLCLSYGFYRTPIVQKHENNFTIKHVENAIQTEDTEKEQCKPTNISKSVATMTKKTLENNFDDNNSYYPLKDRYMYSRLYPESNKDIESQLFLDELPKKEITKKTTKEKEIQTNFELRKFNKSVQTFVKTFNVAVQVNDDELEDPSDKTVYDVQNIFRCTHEFTFNIKKEFNSNFNYVTYQFPECVTNSTGKVTSCCRMFRTFGNTNILHLITLPSTIPLETYFYNNYKKSAILLNLHRNHDYSPHKISLLVSHLIDMAHEFKTSHITKQLILNNNCSLIEDSSNNVHIKIHYKRVYHSFPFPEENSKTIVDLTESHSEDNSINQTYTLFKHNDRLVGTTAENSTQTDSMPIQMSQSSKIQTEEEINHQCKIIDNFSNSTEKKIDNVTQTDTGVVIVENIENQSNSKIKQENSILSEFNKSDIFKAKVTIVGGYNLPMVKLNGDNKPSAPTTYVIMEDFNGSHLSTSYVVQQTNPIWNSQWTVVLPKHKLIERKWLTLELWCKKYKNEYAGHDVKRDMRLGYILIDLHALEYDLNQSCGLYDVISETEEHNGQIRVIIDLINNIDPQINYKKPIVSTKEQNVYKKSNDDLINEMIEKIKIENNIYTETKNSKSPIKIDYCDYVDLTGDTPQKFDEVPLKKIAVTESYQKDCFLNNDTFDSETVSSVASWTSSSDDVLCSNNPQITNILGNKTKVNQIKQIISS